MNQRESRKRVEIKTEVTGTEIDAQGMIESEIETEVIETVRTIEAIIVRGDDYFHLTFFASHAMLHHDESLFTVRLQTFLEYDWQCVVCYLNWYGKKPHLFGLDWSLVLSWIILCFGTKRVSSCSWKVFLHLVTGGAESMIVIETGGTDTDLVQTLLEGLGITLDPSHHHDHNHVTGEGVLLSQSN